MAGPLTPKRQYGHVTEIYPCSTLSLCRIFRAANRAALTVASLPGDTTVVSFHDSSEEKLRTRSDFIAFLLHSSDAPPLIQNVGHNEIHVLCGHRSHLLPTRLPVGVRTKRLTSVVQTVTRIVTVWQPETSSVPLGLQLSACNWVCRPGGALSKPGGTKPPKNSQPPA